MGYRFAPECNHAQESLYTRHLFRFFLLLPWQRDVTTSFSIREGTCLLLVLLPRPRSLARNVLASRRQSLGTPNILYLHYILNLRALLYSGQPLYNYQNPSLYCFLVQIRGRVF